MERFPHLGAWVGAWEARPSYLASKADYYSVVKALPSQNGPGYSAPDRRVEDIAARIDGLDDAWRLPLRPARLEPVASLQVYTLSPHLIGRYIPG